VEKVRVGKKHALYLPKSVVRALGLREGDKLLLIVEDDKIVLQKIKSFFQVALETPKKLSLTPGDVEKASIEMQRELLGG